MRFEISSMESSTQTVNLNCEILNGNSFPYLSCLFCTITFKTFEEYLQHELSAIHQGIVNEKLTRMHQENDENGKRAEKKVRRRHNELKCLLKAKQGFKIEKPSSKKKKKSESPKKNSESSKTKLGMTTSTKSESSKKAPKLPKPDVSTTISSKQKSESAKVDRSESSKSEVSTTISLKRKSESPKIESKSEVSRTVSSEKRSKSSKSKKKSESSNTESKSLKVSSKKKSESSKKESKSEKTKSDKSKKKLASTRELTPLPDAGLSLPKEKLLLQNQVLHSPIKQKI